MKRRLLGKVTISSLCLLCSTATFADDEPVAKASVYDGSGIKETAQLKVSKGVRLSYDSNGKLVVKVAGNDNNVAELPMNKGVSLHLSYSGYDETQNKKEIEVQTTSTFSSVFQVIIPDGVDVYAPTYDVQTGTVMLDESRKLTAGTVLPAGTGVIIKHNGKVEFAYSEDIASEVESCLTSSVVATPVREYKGPVYTVGAENGTLSFLKYEAEMTEAGKAYFIQDDKNAGVPPIKTDEVSTSIIEITGNQISNDANTYNLAGQRLNADGRNYSGIVIKNGKKYLNK